MAFTPEQIAKIRQKEATLPDALKRNPSVNYYHGWFFVTLNTRDEVPVLSMCGGDVNITDGKPGAPHCLYTKVGQGVLESWKRIPSICNTAEIDICEVMPEHFHGLIHLLPGNKRHLGSLISGFMSGCTHAYWDVLGIDWHSNRYDQGASALKIDRDPDHTRSYRGPALFVRGYNDVEPITENELEIKRAYIREQARKRLIQGERHECFHKYRNRHSKNWTYEKAMMAVYNDKFFQRNPEKCNVAQQNVTNRLNILSGHIGLDHIGCKQLLSSPNKLPLICHRADASLFEQQKNKAIQAARQGAIIVSAFISPNEREIKQLLIMEQLPFIEILDNGISDKYKGIGKTFYTLAEGKVCLITPWKYLYQKDMTVSREMCLVMNELVRVISGKKEDWWKGVQSVQAI